ncbi:gustatory receptor for sugar taste 43a-like [Schistocerca piceifrons]|uniref:gustatory receptor for sugar taste 43a-like n=1 Tax=Schistocerca piceifrons TaxID=274613 RepID=UPI001F5EEB58|nr:gustatory receptor for sugar taste 43a-like [Schistocerca piceifrons]
MEVWIRFRDLNKCVAAVVTRYGDPRLSRLLLDQTPVDDHQAELRHIRLAHATLIRGAELLQRHIGTTMALTVVNSFSGAIFTSYGVLALWTSPDRTKTTTVYRYLWTSMVAFFFHITRLTAMAVSCSAAANQAENTRLLVSRAAAVDVPPVRRSELAALQSQVAETPHFSFTAAGFTTVDRRLLVTVLSATISYLVIVEQISLS